MKLSNDFRTLWYAILLFYLIGYLWWRVDEVNAGDVTVIDATAFVVLIGLLLAPLFSEVSIFGMTLKTELRELKAEVKREIADLKIDLTNQIDFQTQVNPSFHITTAPAPPPDDRLPELEERLLASIRGLLAERGVQTQKFQTLDLRVDDAAVSLFRVRYAMETELRRIYDERVHPDASERPRFVPVNRMVRELTTREVLDPRLMHAIHELGAVANAAIHGEHPTTAQLGFVEDVAPEVIAALRTI